MAEQQKMEIIVVAFGTLGMLILALSLISFVVLYHKKRTKLELEKTQKENDFQRELVNAIIEARENEQKRIAIELHDGIGSNLTAIKMNLHKKNLDENEIQIIIDRLKSTVKQVREISHDLLPPVLNELGLCGAIRDLCRRLEEQRIIQITCEIEDHSNIRFNEQEELAIYRIVQELINNILKHSKANEISLKLSLCTKEFLLEITDNGTGFSVTDSDLRKSGSLGLKNIASRVQQINADLSYEKLIPKGTKTTLKRTL